MNEAGWLLIYILEKTHYSFSLWCVYFRREADLLAYFLMYEIQNKLHIYNNKNKETSRDILYNI